MEHECLTLAPRSAPGEVVTFYSYESGTARSMALSNTALLLAGREHGTAPVLMIDWDLDAPALHHIFPCRDTHGGVLELFEACRARLRELGPGAAGPDGAALAGALLDGAGWQRYVQRVDPALALYLMPAAGFGANYRERAARLRWDELFDACPALFRCLAERCARLFAHVLVDARTGRGDSASICTTLVPDKLVALFTPNRYSVEGLDAVVRRAIDYRCSHEEEQRPLLVYPLASWIDSADAERRALWRHGAPGQAMPGYQGAFEQLLRYCYGLSRISLDSYFDEVQLQQTHGQGSCGQLAVQAERGGDRFSLTRTFDTLLAWLVPGHFPWQSRAEIALLEQADQARAAAHEGAAAALALPLGRALDGLAAVYQHGGRERQALACQEESVALWQRALGEEHAETLAAKACLADLLRAGGQYGRARFLGEIVLEARARTLGADHAATLASRAALAATLALEGDFPAALALREELVAAHARLLGGEHPRTLAAMAGHADTLMRQGELHQARALYERVIAAREQVLGSEHADTLASRHELARILCRLDEAGAARAIQEPVLRARERQLGGVHPDTLRARALLAHILTAAGELTAARKALESLYQARARSLGPDHPSTLATQLELAAILGRQGELEAARRIEEHVVSRHEGLRGAQDWDTLRSKNQLANTLWKLGERVAALTLEDSVLLASERLLGTQSGGAHGPGTVPQAALRALQDAILAGRKRERERAAEHPDVLGNQINLVQSLLDSDNLQRARHVADGLRAPLLGPGIAPTLRRRGMALLRKMYQLQGDHDALLALQEDEVLVLADGATPGAQAGDRQRRAD